MFCPQVYGLYLVKLALAICLAGGVERQDDGGTRVRGEPHLLLVGDPGKTFSSMASKSIISSGLEPVLRHTEKSCIVSKYTQFLLLMSAESCL